MAPENKPESEQSAIEAGRLELERQRLQFERDRYAAESPQRDAELQIGRIRQAREELERRKIEAEINLKRSDRRLSYLQVVLSTLTPLAVIVAAFITFNKETLIRDSDALKQQTKDLATQRDQIARERDGAKTDSDRIVHQKEQLQREMEAGQKRLAVIAREIVDTKRNADRVSRLARVEAYVDELKKTKPTLSDPMFEQLRTELLSDPDGSKYAYLAEETESTQTAPPLQLLLAYNLARANKEQERWAHYVQIVADNHPIETVSVAASVLHDPRMFGYRTREGYLRALYGKKEELTSVRDVARGAFITLYSDDVMSVFREPLIEAIRATRDRLLHGRPFVSLFPLGNWQVAFLALMKSDRPLSPNMVGAPPADARGAQPSGGFAPQHERDLFFSLVGTNGWGVPNADAWADFSEERRKWLRDPGNQELARVFVDDESVSAINHVSDGVIQRLRRNVWIGAQEFIATGNPLILSTASLP